MCKGGRIEREFLLTILLLIYYIYYIDIIIYIISSYFFFIFIFFPPFFPVFSPFLEFLPFLLGVFFEGVVTDECVWGSDSHISNVTFVLRYVCVRVEKKESLTFRASPLLF